MFTGIVETLGRVDQLERRDGRVRIRVEAPFAAELRPDQSVAVDGICLTVVGQSDRAFDVDVVEETLAKTNFSRLTPGEEVNLERALRADGRFDGHFVQGHGDATGEIVEITDDEQGRLVAVRFPPRFAAYLIPAGSVALDGISFTVARLGEEVLTVAVIPHTWEHTTMRRWEAGRRVNLEFDLLGKYVVRALRYGLGDGPDSARRFLTG